MRATAEEDDIYAAVDLLIYKLTRQPNKYTRKAETILI
ncbi:hypothetical protein [Sodalis sp.]